MVDAFGPEFSIFFVCFKTTQYLLKTHPKTHPIHLQDVPQTQPRRIQRVDYREMLVRLCSSSSSGGCCIGVGRFWEDFPVIAKISPRRFKMPRDIAKTPQSASRPRFCLNEFGCFWHVFGKILGDLLRCPVTLPRRLEAPPGLDFETVLDAFRMFLERFWDYFGRILR